MTIIKLKSKHQQHLEEKLKDILNDLENQKLVTFLGIAVNKDDDIVMWVWQEEGQRHSAMVGLSTRLTHELINEVTP